MKVVYGLVLAAQFTVIVTGEDDSMGKLPRSDARDPPPGNGSALLVDSGRTSNSTLETLNSNAL